MLDTEKASKVKKQVWMHAYLYRCIQPTYCMHHPFNFLRILANPCFSYLQVEFYFSDSNLYRDNFLHDKVKSDKDGFVDIALLCIFSRMQALLDSSAGEVSKVSDETIAGVAAALKDSTTLVISEDGRQVRRAEVRIYSF